MTAERWPNGIGWNVFASITVDGEPVKVEGAEVRDCVSSLRVFLPYTDPDEPANIDLFKACDVPVGTDPIIAVMVCANAGRVFDTFVSGVVPFVPALCAVNPVTLDR